VTILLLLAVYGYRHFIISIFPGKDVRHISFADTQKILQKCIIYLNVFLTCFTCTYGSSACKQQLEPPFGYWTPRWYVDTATSRWWWLGSPVSTQYSPYPPSCEILTQATHRFARLSDTSWFPLAVSASKYLQKERSMRVAKKRGGQGNGSTIIYLTCYLQLHSYVSGSSPNRLNSRVTCNTLCTSSLQAEKNVHGWPTQGSPWIR